MLGMLEGAPILASETCALDIIGAEFVRDIKPGEMVVIDKDGINPDRVLQQLADRNVVAEQFGGDVPVVTYGAVVPMSTGVDRPFIAARMAFVPKSTASPSGCCPPIDMVVSTALL